MNNITKKFVVILSSLFLSLNAFAGELAVSGSVKASYNISGGQGDNNDVGLGISNELMFKASGELDNGFTGDDHMELDGNDGGAHDNDDSALVIGMGGMGNLAICDSECGLSTETGYGIGALGVGDDFGNTDAMVGNDISIGDYGNVQYHAPADLLPFGLTAKIGYVPNNSDGDNNSYKSTGGENTAGADGQSERQIQITAKPIDGLSIGADYFSVDGTSGVVAQEAEAGGWYANYAIGNLKFGYGERYLAPGIGDKVSAGAHSYEHEQVGVELAINDAFSISYSTEESTRKSYGAAASPAAGGTPFTRTQITMESDFLQAAYDIGGATVGIANIESSNSGYAAGDKTRTIVSLAMAF